MNTQDFKVCPNCAGERTVHAVKAFEKRVVCDEEFEVPVEYFECERCNESFQSLGADHGLAHARNLYRQRHHMVLPEQLIAWRKSLGVTQPELAAILGWGTATISRYENGKLQSEAHDKAMRMAMRDPENTLNLVLNAKDLAPEVRERLVEQLRKEAASTAVEKAFLTSTKVAPGESVRVEKLAKLVVMLCDQAGVFVTKLNKLLFYADFKLYKEQQRTISGLCYERLPYGPVPANFRLLFALLEQRGDVRQVEVPVGQVEGTRVAPLVEADRNCFDDAELAVILDIKKRFESMTAKEISDFSHRESAWLETPTGAVISYQHAARLSV